MKGNIYISGQIGSFEGVSGVELIDIISQVQKQPNSSSYDVYIDSEGGFLEVAFDIYNYLKNLGKPINTIGSGIVASAATVIFMAGEKRTVRNNTPFMIHLPWIEAVGSADEVEQYAKELRKIENSLVDFYKKTLNLSVEAIRPLLVNETWLTDEQLSSLGFTTNKPVMAKAKAYIKTDNKMSKSKEADKGKNSVKALVEWAKNVLGIKNKIVFDAENREVDFYDLNDEDVVEVGAMATIGGEPAEGNVLMADGKTYVFASGELVDIIEEGAEDEEMAALKEENESLAEENGQLIEALAAIKAKYEEKEQEINTIKAKLKGYEKAQSRFAPKDKKERENGEKPTAASAALARLKEQNKPKN